MGSPYRSPERTGDASKKSVVLDVGAIDHQYRKIKDLAVVPIDLNPQHPDVHRADFFDFAKEMIRNDALPDYCCSRAEDDVRSDTKFDVIVMSLVLNFVGDPRLRGQMLALAAHSRILRRGGLLFVVLPRACLFNSRYMTNDTFRDLVCSLGFQVVREDTTQKLYLGAFRLGSAFDGYNAETGTFRFGTEFKRSRHLRGSDRNNFCVMLKNE